MRTAVFAVTGRGRDTAKRISEYLEADYYDFSVGLVKKLFHEYDALVFIMALGIVVRTIASEIGNKRSDPLVVAVDEAGMYVISVLCGHRGANDLAREIANRTGGVPVVTTGTDVMGKLSAEEVAMKMGLEIDYESDVKVVNAAIAGDKKVGIYVDPNIHGADGLLHRIHLLGFIPQPSSDEPDVLMVITNRKCFTTHVPAAIMRPRNLIVGLGAKKGVDSARVLKAIRKSFEGLDLSMKSIRALATADFKVREKGFIDAAMELGVPLLAVRAKEIRENEGRFISSEAVRAKFGVGAVCEPCAILAGEDARLVMRKTRYNGVTVAIAEERVWVNST
jgi:cobalt-precorrin 5A hydrolase